MEKLTLFKDCDVVIYNGDNELISNCVAKSMLTAREIAWSRRDIERPLYISRVIKKDDTCRPDNRADGPSRTDCHASGGERRKE